LLCARTTETSKGCSNSYSHTTRLLDRTEQLWLERNVLNSDLWNPMYVPNCPNTTNRTRSDLSADRALVFAEHGLVHEGALLPARNQGVHAVLEGGRRSSRAFVVPCR
jgi:hypothetical protein